MFDLTLWTYQLNMLYLFQSQKGCTIEVIFRFEILVLSRVLESSIDLKVRVES